MSKSSVRDYAVLYLAPKAGGGAAIIGGGNAILTTGTHALDGPEHNGKGDLHSPWTIVAGGTITPTPGDPPVGEVVLQVKTTAGAPTHTASLGTPCWVEPDEVLYVNSDGGTTWATVAGGVFVTVTGGGKETVNTVAAAGATETLDLGDGNVHDITLDADCTLTFAGATAGVACSFTLLLRQDGTGGWDVTWPGSVVWAGGTAPTLDTTASTVSVLTFFTLDGGTTWYGFPTGGSGVAGGTPALTFGTTNAAGTAGTAVLTDATIAVFDATVPSTAAFDDAAATGSASFAARRDHVHGMPSAPTGGGVGAILISDAPSTPLVFADLIQNEAQDDLVYADP